MSKDVHIYVGDEDPYVFSVGDVTVHVHLPRGRRAEVAERAPHSAEWLIGGQWSLDEWMSQRFPGLRPLATEQGEASGEVVERRRPTPPMPPPVRTPVVLNPAARLIEQPHDAQQVAGQLLRETAVPHVDLVGTTGRDLGPLIAGVRLAEDGASVHVLKRADE